jgi:hypothetical protein
MAAFFTRLRRRARAAARARLWLESLESRTVPDAVRWLNPAGGDWGVAANWSTGHLPGPGDVAILDIPGVTVTHSTGTDAVSDLVASNGTFVFAGGTLDVAHMVQGSSAFRLDGGRLAHATVSAGTAFTATFRHSALDGVTFAAGATLDLNDPSAPAHVDVFNGLTVNGTANLGDATGHWQGELFFQGTQSVLGTGRLNIRPAGAYLYQDQTTSSLTLGAGLTIQGPLNVSSLGTLLNQATITAGQREAVRVGGGTFTNRGPITSAGGSVVIAATGWVNYSTIQVQGGGLELNGRAWSNLGVLSVTDTAVSLTGYTRASTLGDFRRSGGSVIDSGTVDAHDQPLQLNARTGSWMIGSGCTLLGNVNLTEGAQLFASNSLFDGVTVNGDLELGFNGESFRAQHGLAVTGTLYVGDRQERYFGSIEFDGDQTLSVGRGVVFSGQRGNQLLLTSSLTIGANTLIHGKEGTIKGLVPSEGNLINRGTIMADTAGGQINVDTATFFNTGTLGGSGGNLRVGGLWQSFTPIQFTGPGFLTLDGTYVYGFPLTMTGGTLSLYGNARLADRLTVQNTTVYVGTTGSHWSLNALDATNSTVNLGGTFRLADLASLTRHGGTVNVTGTLDNSGTTLALDASTGSWSLAGGRIVGGTIQTSGGAQLLGTDRFGTLVGVTLDGELAITASNARVTVENGLVLNGTVFLGGPDGNGLFFAGSQSVTSTAGGTIVFSNSPNNGIAADLLSGTITLTFGPGITIHGARGSISAGPSASGTIVNHGTILADTDGGQLTLLVRTWSNDGTLGAANGGTLRALGSSTNLVNGTLTGGTFEAFADSTLDLEGAAVRANAATLILDGPNSRVVSSLSGTDALAGLAVNTADGVLWLSGGRALTTGDFTNAGYLFLGAGSLLKVGGSFTQAATGVLDVQLADHPDTGLFGQLSAGAVALDGTLRVSLADGFVPDAGDAFRVLSWGDRTGSFARYDLPDLGPDLFLVPLDQGDGLTVLAVPAP